MMPRLTYVVITLFWLAMNVWLWRAEYGSQGGEVPVPVSLVWRKILTAPDVSSLNVYQNGERTGFCEFSTSVEQAMAALDADQPPPEGLLTRAGYQLRLDGNISLGDFSDRLRFDGRARFFPNRAWRELDLKLTTRNGSVELQSQATHQTVHLIFTSGDRVIAHDVTFADLQDPGALLRAVVGDFGSGVPDDRASSELPPPGQAPASSLHWKARRERVMMHHEPVSAYRLETEVLQNRIVIYVSTLGEILRVELPGGVTARLDE
ncbi:MAG: hypothetical protein KGJ60_08795 [Verrucomicrobiota bacterium]|nr:hypothetical protein [Verrucomicrobiota bacterium]